MLYCPKCGSNAAVLLNLVSCITPTCRNYDAKWDKEWTINNSPRFRQMTIGHNYRYLGRHNEIFSNPPTPPVTVTFDLHCYRPTQFSSFVCLARFGNSDSECYYVDEKETEIGLLSSGPIKTCPAHIIKALKESLKRFQRR